MEGLVTLQPKEMLFRPVIRFWDLSPFLVERLINALRPLMIFPLVEGVGFGYLVPQEVLLSVWVFYFALKLVALISVGAKLTALYIPASRT